MKKVFFTLAFMLIGTVVFANNVENKKTTLVVNDVIELVNTIETTNSNYLITEFEIFGTCYVSIGFYGEDGERIGGAVIAFENVNSAAECDQLADDVANALADM